MRAILDACRPQYIPGEVISAFAGIQSEEIRPKPNTHKDPLRWEDFNWDEAYINVRDETARLELRATLHFCQCLKLGCNRGATLLVR